ncbi:MAG TPA: hypothetical protein VN905_15865 [Candidatus Binatia bacterium]|nr:hypothetical protein [Candidatus Binatia bacterium]
MIAAAPVRRAEDADEYIMRRPHVSNEVEWRKFEFETWRRAIRDRGLKLRFLDAEHQQALFESIKLPITLRSYRLRSRVSKTLLRIAAMALMMLVGYFAHDFTPAAAKGIARTVAVLSHPYAGDPCDGDQGCETVQAEAVYGAAP